MPRRKRPHVQEAITRVPAERVGASKAGVLNEISSIAFAEPSEAIWVGEKLNALALLSKVLDLMVNGQDIGGPNGQPAVIGEGSRT